MHKLESVLENEIHKTHLDFKIQTDNPIQKKTRPSINKKRTCHLVDFADPPGHRLKIKQSENIDKYLNLTRELKKLLN